MKIGHKISYHVYHNNEFMGTRYFYEKESASNGLHRLFSYNKEITHEYHYCIFSVKTLEMTDKEEYYPKVYNQTTESV